MPPLHRRLLPFVLTAAVGALAAGSALGATSPDRFMGELHADITNAKGTRIAAISGNVGTSGLGWGDVVPLNAARSVGMRRPERVRLVAMRDATIVVQGQHGTRLTFSDRGHGEMAQGYGTLRTSPSRRVAVNANGFWDQKPFLPTRGKRILMIGKVKGALRTALSKRYPLVAYSGATHSRTALMRNPSRYRQIAGLIVGSGVSASQLAKLDLARSLHNDGRLVATTLRNGMLDRHMYVVSHAHTGQGGVILRREAPRLGYQVHSYPQIREPILTNSLVGGAKALPEPGTYTAEARQQAVEAGIRSVGQALARAERLAPLPKPKKAKKGTKKSEMQTSSASDPATVSAGSDDAAFYTVPVSQYIAATVTAPSVVPNAAETNWSTGYLQLTNPSVGLPNGVATKASIVSVWPADGDVPPPGVPHGYAPGACLLGMQTVFNSQGTATSWNEGWACAQPPSSSLWGSCVVSMPAYSWFTQTTTGSNAPMMQVSSSKPVIAAEVVWSCSSAPPATPISQAVGITYNPIYTVSLTQSSTEVTTQAVTETNAAQFNALAMPSTPLAVGTYSNTTGVASSGPSPASSASSEAAFGLSMAYHSVVMDCSTCKGTAGGAVTPVFQSNASSPTQQVTQVAANTATGISTSLTNESDWSTSTSKESGWDVSATVGMFGKIPNGSVSGGYNSSITKTTSQGGSVSNTQGTSLTSSSNFTTSNWTTTPTQGQAQALYTTFSSTVTGAGGSAASAAYSLPFPAALTGNSAGFIKTPTQYGGPGPGPTCAAGPGCGPPVLSPQPAGSNENLTGFTQGSTSFFNLVTASSQLGTGSVTPWVNDTFYLFDQGFLGSTPLGAYLELQVLGQSQVSVSAQTVSGSASAGTVQATSSGSSGAEGITTYYDGSGQVVNSASGATYQTTGLDLCAPPVLTPDLWNAGCDNDLNFAGPPGVYQGSPPNITTASTTNPLQFNGSTGQAEVGAPAPELTCNPGNWSGSPTFAYQWQQWNPAFGDWQDISGATDVTYTPPSSLTQDTYFTCNVTGTNSMGSVSEPAASVEVIVGD